jgi:hypothetical protein
MAPKKKKKNKQIKRKKILAKKLPPKKKALPRKAAPKRKAVRKKGRVRGKSERAPAIAFEPERLGPRPGGQSGDLQGLSNVAGADSESVDELLEEGNAFEAGVVEGVEDAPDADQGAIRTREVPENDVPEEYSDKDQ